MSLNWPKGIMMSDWEFFSLFWLTGRVQVVSARNQGNVIATLAHAMTNFNIGEEALKALDYWEKMTEVVRYKGKKRKERLSRYHDHKVEILRRRK